MPALTHFYGLKPWDVERLTLAEIDTYQEHLADYMDEVKRANAERR